MKKYVAPGTVERRYVAMLSSPSDRAHGATLAHTINKSAVYFFDNGTGWLSTKGCPFVLSKRSSLISTINDEAVCVHATNA